MDVNKIIGEAIQDANADKETLVKNAIRRSIEQLDEAQMVFKVRRDSHIKLISDIRTGTFDYISAAHNRNIRER